MDSRAFYKMSYGLYIISTIFDNKASGCVVNTLEQVTSSPAKLAVAINKDNYTAKTLLKSGVYAGVALTESADMKLIGEFGFKSSEKVDKFQGFKTATDSNGIPYVTESVAARFSVKVTDTVDLGSHIMFIGEVTDCEVLSDEEVMTYAYYHKVKKGTTPPKASSYNKTPDVPAADKSAAEKPVKGYRCSVCSYIVNTDTIPADFECPICGEGKDKLEKIV